MARIRTIKPTFFTSLTVANLTVEQRLTFIGLWTHVDDAGRCVADGRLIKAALWPLDDRSPDDVMGDLDALTEAGLIVPYTADGRCYLQVTGWSEHQRISRPTKSDLPAPPSDNKPLTSTIEDSLRTHGGLSEDSAQEGKGKEGKGRERDDPLPDQTNTSTPLPFNWQPTAAHRQYAEANRLDLEAEAEKFRNRRNSEGRTSRDWDADFQGWLIRGVEHAAKNTAGPRYEVHTAREVKADPPNAAFKAARARHFGDRVDVDDEQGAA